VSIAAADLASLRLRVGKALTAFLARQRDRLADIDPCLCDVATALEAFLLHRGKRLRPAFAYWGFRGAGGTDSEELMAAISALELVQAGALIHDDVMDSSDTRRGEPAIHRRFADLHARQGWGGDRARFGRAAAILLGDLCLVWSDELLHGSGLEPAMLARARPVFDEMRTEVTVGQYLDMYTQVTGEPSIERACRVARYKSAKYTVERPLLLGAALAGALEPVCAAYSGYGLPLGEAFQLRDDVLGVYGDPARTGKPAGDDLREGKRTYLVAAAFEASDQRQREILMAGLGNQALDEPGLALLRELIRTTGALARTERRIEKLTSDALAALRGADLDREVERALTALAEAATTRLD
jgi:geranylgeranyl diphosphate synthase type I